MSKVSIIVPIYNVAPYLKQCLDSVASQTYKDLEVLLVDDCGTDDSMAIAENFVVNYSGPIVFKILHHDHNRGLSAARNTGIRAAIGEYLYFLDSDDWITQDCIESLISCLDKHPGCDIVFAGATATAPGYEWMDYTNKNLPDYSDNAIWIKAMMLRRYVFSMTAWNKLVRKDFIISNNLFFDEGFVREDEMWNFMLAKFVIRASFCKKNTYYYVVRNDGIMKSRSIEVEVGDLQKVVEKLLGKIDSFLEFEQALCLWNLCFDVYSNKELIKSSKKALKITLKKLNEFFDSRTKFLFNIFLLSPAIFIWLDSLPKIKGYINIKLKRYCSY